jgi:hypothetical protein
MVVGMPNMPSYLGLNLELKEAPATARSIKRWMGYYVELQILELLKDVQELFCSEARLKSIVNFRRQHISATMIVNSLQVVSWQVSTNQR